MSNITKEAYQIQRLIYDLYNYRFFEKEALKMCAHRNYVSGYQIVQYLRYYVDTYRLGVKGENSFKFDNTMTPLYVNLFVHRHPEYKKKFNIKRHINLKDVLTLIDQKIKELR